ncbi:hypothetical protein [uncultured Psychrobacter sp.]|uniref:hypothetical protein n=1 Tax=uncultured Psychrobacter sp. TaxID=259303 RepID=UPI0026319256|nr:hypothetical protein [uncultured Psychrobacter sp.]
MDITSIAKLQKKGILISPVIADLFKIYAEDIRPFLDHNKNLKLEQRRALFKLTILIKSDKKQLLANNFEIYYLLKSHNLEQDTLRQNVLISSSAQDECDFGIAFFELIDIISRHKALLDLKVILEKFQKILTEDMTQNLLKKNFFAITTFCHLIGITEQAYYSRIKRS